MTWKRFVKSPGLMLALVSTVGCGDALRDGTYVGEARYVVQGEVKSLAPATKQGKTRVTLAWDNWAREGDVISYQSVELTSQNPPFDYQLSVVDTPEEMELNDFQGGLIGFAYLLVYEDGNGDGMPDGDEARHWKTLRGMARNHVVLYVPQLSPGFVEGLREWGGFINVDDLKPGFNLARGVCTGTDSSLDTLEIVPDEPVLVADPGDKSVTSCINYH
jgi:hypothetical protein